MPRRYPTKFEQCFDLSPHLTPQFQIDTAVLNFVVSDRTGNNIDDIDNYYDRNGYSYYSLWTQTSECFRCPLVEVCNQIQSQLLMNTTNPTLIEVRRTGNGSSNTVCRLSHHFQERGIYNLSILSNDLLPFERLNSSSNCTLTKIEGGIFTYLPMIVVILLLFLLRIMALIGRKVYYQCKVNKNRVSTNQLDVMSSAGSSSSGTINVDRAVTPEGISQESVGCQSSVGLLINNDNGTKTTRKRLFSLDIFRGISIFLMVYVNYGGGAYYIMAHSAWNGLTIADLVFPWFMWIMGVSLGLSQRGRGNGSFWRKLYLLSRRTVILFILGLMVSNSGGVRIDRIRIMGVLQRFALCFFLVSGMRTLVCYRQTVVFKSIEWLFFLGLVLIHTLLTFCLPVPGCPTGYLGPGGIGDQVRYPKCTGGAAAYIDRTVLGESHVYQTPTSRYIYNTDMSHDPEGLLGTLTSSFLVFLGLQAAGIVIPSSANNKNDRLVLKVKILWLTGYGLVTGLAAGILCRFSQNDGWIPVNKNLWSLSYVLCMASFSYFLFTLLYLIADVYEIGGSGGAAGFPFRQVGANSLLVYCGHELIYTIPFRFQLPPTVPPCHAIQLVMDLAQTLLWVALAVYWDYIGFYWTV